MEKLEQMDGFITFGDWFLFKSKFEDAKNRVFPSERALCEFMGVDYGLYERIIESAVNSWMVSPSRSLLQALGKVGFDLPQKGELVFDSILAQTRFLMVLGEMGDVPVRRLGNIRDSAGSRIRIKGEYALTYPSGEWREPIEDKVNAVLQILYLYALYCSQKRVPLTKLPKLIYRGVRLGSIFGIDDVKQSIGHVTRGQKEGYLSYWRREVDALIEYICSHPLRSICEYDLVSFSSSKPTATRFTRNEGLILEVKTADIELLTSCLHDERLATRDDLTGKFEKEYIARVLDSTFVTNVYPYDTNYLVATSNPLCVSVFDHDDKHASYELNGVKIEASFYWATNRRGRIVYRNLNDSRSFSYTEREFKKEYGFSPAIQEKDVDNVKDFRAWRTTLSGKRETGFDDPDRKKLFLVSI